MASQMASQVGRLVARPHRPESDVGLYPTSERADFVAQMDLLNFRGGERRHIGLHGSESFYEPGGLVPLALICILEGDFELIQVVGRFCHHLIDKNDALGGASRRITLPFCVTWKSHFVDCLNAATAATEDARVASVDQDFRKFDDVRVITCC